jgi:hypothetical protein
MIWLGCLLVWAGYGMALIHGRERATPVSKRADTTASAWWDQVWDEYHRDRISLVSALLRVEALFAARVAEIDDWDAVDWTISPLEPTTLGWKWDGDRLVEAPALEVAQDRILASLAVPSHIIGCLACGHPFASDQLGPDRVCYACHANARGGRVVAERLIPRSFGGELGYVRERVVQEYVPMTAVEQVVAEERAAIGHPIIFRDDLPSIG